jgi:hypothetical protein
VSLAVTVLTAALLVGSMRDASAAGQPVPSEPHYVLDFDGDHAVCPKILDTYNALLGDFLGKIRRHEKSARYSTNFILIVEYLCG